ncbi:hypothetical protein P9E76_01695 [Schinkia azotoformans]|uniref:Uncharacterized protein n=1 Tax=Schinkia azotoformans LMG 9581 TaxID=1131731 RepID=K6D5P4_SCHAZ|nr:hypothetical protein [Schinkia azotoformans]EKN67847.1 hypothetical protein BAZO_08194 [Schinkia azotoformans LMG 9581]MEC1637387.1 hypothetical protein [Schinkia azotoformans]MEC1943791.1 hypothetical protein [Schinkia azotoformans]
MSQNQIAKQNNSTAILGETEVFIRRSAAGAIKAIKGKVNLLESKGHLAKIQDKVMITEAGYRELNKIAGVSIITPEKLTLPDGKVVVNPYPIVDPVSGTISKVWVKKIGIGYSPIGNLVITSSTLLYDIQMYLIQDLAKKVQYNKDAGRICMEQTLSEEDMKRGAFFKIEGNVGVWVDLSHKDVLKAFDTFINNKLFAERKAQTICERNVLKKHPSLSTTYVEPQMLNGKHVGQVTVIGFTHDLSKDELLEMADQAERGEPIKVRGEDAQIIDHYDDVTEEDIVSSTDEDEIAQQVKDEGQQPAQNQSADPTFFNESGVVF